MANPPDIHQNVVLHLDTVSLTAEIDAALTELAGGLSRRLPQLAMPSLGAGALPTPLDLSSIFASLNRFGVALDGLATKLERLTSPAVAASPAPSTGAAPAAAGSLWAMAATTPELANAIRNLSPQAYSSPETASAMAAVVGQLNRQESQLRQLEGRGGASSATIDAALRSLQSSAATIAQARSDLDQRLASIDQTAVAHSLGQAAGAGKYGPVTLTPAERYALEAGRTDATLSAAQSQAQRLSAGFAALPVNNSSPYSLSQIGGLLEGGALGFAAGQQIASGIQGALSPLEPLMGGNALNGVGVAEQLAPIFNVATQGQRSPLSYAGVRQASTVAGMPISSTLETSLAAQMASGIAGGMFFFHNASDLFQFSQALGVNANTVASVAGLAQIGGVSNFNGYFSGLLGTMGGTGLTNSAFLTELAQIQQALTSMGVSPAGAELGFGTFATAAHLGGVNGQQAVGLFNAFNSAQTGPASNIFQGYAQLASEGTWLKTPGVSQALGFPTNNSIGAGVAMGIFQNTPLMQGPLGEAKMLSMLNYLTPLAQGAATNPSDLLAFMSSTGLGYGPQSEQLMHLLATPATAHYLTGALNAEIGGGTTGLKSYLHDVTNSKTRGELQGFLNSYKGSPESNLQNLQANIQSAKLTIGNATLAGESGASGLPSPALGLGGLVANTATNVLGVGGGILGAKYLGSLLPNLLGGGAGSAAAEVGAGAAATEGAASTAAGLAGAASATGPLALLGAALGVFGYQGISAFDKVRQTGNIMSGLGSPGMSVAPVGAALGAITNLVAGPAGVSTAQQEHFLRSMTPYALQAAHGAGLPSSDAAGILDQWAGETGWGTKLAAKNNLGNITYSSGPDKGQSIPYGSVDAFVHAYDATLTNGPYSNVLNAKSPGAFVDALIASPWASSHYGGPNGELTQMLPQILGLLKQLNRHENVQFAVETGPVGAIVRDGWLGVKP